MTSARRILAKHLRSASCPFGAPAPGLQQAAFWPSDGPMHGNNGEGAQMRLPGGARALASKRLETRSTGLY